MFQKAKEKEVKKSNLIISQIQWLYYSAKRIWKDYKKPFSATIQNF